MLVNMQRLELSSLTLLDNILFLTAVFLRQLLVFTQYLVALPPFYA